MELSTNTPFRIGAWRVQPSLNRISRNGETARVTPKVMQVLCCLAAHRNEVVPREDLLDTVWPDVVVNEDVLTRAVSDLRKVFEDDPQAPEVIETIPKNGYRLIAPVRYEYPGDAMPASAPALDVRVPTPERAVSHHPVRRHVWLGGGLLALIAVMGIAWWFLPGAPAPPVPRSQPVPLTSLPGAERAPALSPDGHQVAFAWQGADGENWDLYVILVGDGTPLRLTDNPAVDHSPAWSPDGQRLAFMRRADGTCDIFMMSALGGSERKVASCGANVTGDLVWSPDGRWLAFADKPAPDASFSIILLDPETGARRQLTTPGHQHWGDSAPAFSPDSRLLAFMRSVSMATQDLFVVPVEGGAPRRVTPAPSALRGHTWTDDGRHLIYATNRGGSMNLWEIPVEGGTPVWIAEAGLNVFRPHLSGGRIVYERRDEATNIMRLALDTGVGVAPIPWMASTRSDLHPAFSPDGARIAFVSDRSGSTELWVSNRGGTEAVRLTSFEAGFVGSPAWSPDGTHLTFDARPEGHADVYVIDAEGGSPRRLTLTSSNDLHPVWSPDGRWIYFGSNRTGAWQIWKQPAEGGDAVPVTTDGGYAPMLSADGTQVYFTRYDQRGLWAMPVAGGSSSPVLNNGGPSSHEKSWTVTPDGVYYLDGDAIVRFDAVTRTATTIGSAPQALSAGGLAVAPYGRDVLYVQAGPQEVDLMLLEVARGL